jgi:amino-acid N-acetyltransferase
MDCGGLEKRLVRKAVSGDVAEIHGIVEAFAEKAVMLKRPVSEIYNNLRDFFVYEENGAILGICGLHISGDDMGEIRSLGVRQGFTGRGIGRSLVAECLKEARSLGLKKVFALTYKVDFFHRLGFKTLNKDMLPQKIWGDCIRCLKFPNCDEVAVIIEL